MKIELIVNNLSAQSWDIKEDNMDIAEKWDLQSRYKHRKAIIDLWINSMTTAYSDLFMRMGDRVRFRISLGSKVNTAEISDEEMQEFEYKTQNIIYAQ